MRGLASLLVAALAGALAAAILQRFAAPGAPLERPAPAAPASAAREIEPAPCRSGRELVFAVDAAWREAGALPAAVLEAAASAFERCGVIVLEGLVADADAASFAGALQELIAPALLGRARLRAAIKRGMLAGWTLDEMWTRLGLDAEPLLGMGHSFRERNPGRIDFALPFASPFAEPQFTANELATPLLRRLLGARMRLKSIHAVVALGAEGGGRGAATQHWHRDDGLLFSEAAREPECSRALPPYAINAFWLLTNLTEQNGPTEFTLGSHRWLSRYLPEEEREAVDWRFTARRGSLVLFDYRTVHRGTANTSPHARPVAMFIYARSWWGDVVNYGENYGGAGNALAPDQDLVSELTPAPRGNATLQQRRRMFRHLARLYRDELAAELDAELPR